MSITKFGMFKDYSDNTASVIGSSVFDLLDSEKSLLVDSNFKTLFTEPKVAKALIKALMPNISDSSEMGTYRLYGDKDISKYSLTQRNDYIRQRYTESTSQSNKTIEFDVLFDYKYGDEPKDVFTINLEMQRNKPSKYNIISRAIYYGARILSNILSSSENYNELHKIYSIWFLNFNYFKDDNEPMHSIGMRSFICSDSVLLNKEIDNVNNIEYSYLEQADLVEVVFIELPKLNNITNLKLKKFVEILTNSNQLELKQKLELLCDLSMEEVNAMLNNNAIIAKYDKDIFDMGVDTTINRLVISMLEHKSTVEFISEQLSLPLEKVQMIANEYNAEKHKI